MAYEHRIYVVRKTKAGYDPKLDKYYAEHLCMFDLGRLAEMHDILRKYPYTNCFIYEPGDGDLEVIEDCYAEPLVEIPVVNFILDLQHIIADSNVTNPMIRPLLAALLSFREDILKNDRNDIVCLHYGY